VVTGIGVGVGVVEGNAVGVAVLIGVGVIAGAGSIEVEMTEFVTAGEMGVAGDVAAAVWQAVSKSVNKIVHMERCEWVFIPGYPMKFILFSDQSCVIRGMLELDTCLN
jgi:hypothetical protein